jgi:uncharacterized protein (DUF2147 family)
MFSPRHSVIFAFAILGSVLITLGRLGATDSDSVLGLWKNEDATFEIFANEGKLGAKIVALREPLAPDGKAKTDVHNPDASKHERPIIGMVFMSGFTPAGPGKWEHGSIYDPNSGNTYSCNMELEGSDTLKVRTFIGISLIGSTDVWTRAAGSEK